MRCKTFMHLIGFLGVIFLTLFMFPSCGEEAKPNLDEKRVFNSILKNHQAQETAPDLAKQAYSLEDLIQYALEHHPAGISLDHQVNEAEANFKQESQRNTMNPMLMLSGGAFHSFEGDSSPVGEVSYTHTYDSRNMYLGRKIMASNQKKRVQAEKQAFKNNITSSIQFAFISVLIAQKKKTYIQAIIQDVKKIEVLIQSKIEAGASNRLELLTLQIRITELKTMEIEGESELEKAILSLKQACFYPYDTPLLIQEMDVDQMLQSRRGLWAVNELMEQVAENKTMIRFAYYDLLDIEGEIRLSRAKRYPYSSITGSVMMEMDSVKWSLGVSIPLPYVNRYRHELEGLRQKEIAIKAELEAQFFEIQGEIARLLEDFRTQNRLIEVYTHDLVPFAKENVQLATEQYQLGGLNVLYLIEYETMLIEAQMNRLQVIYEWYQTSFELEQLMDSLLRRITL